MTLLLQVLIYFDISHALDHDLNLELDYGFNLELNLNLDQLLDLDYVTDIDPDHLLDRISILSLYEWKRYDRDC